MSDKSQVPEGYKKTEFGVIPKEWNIGTLDNIAEINPKTDTSSFEENTKVTFLPMQNVGENGKILKYETRNYNEVKKGYTCFAEKDVLFAKITPCMENGKGALATNLENKVGFGSTEYHVLRSKQNGSPEYIFYLTKWDKFRKESEKHMTGSAGQRRVSKNVFFSYKLPIPPLSEQQKIASILSKVDEQIEQTEQIIEKTEILKKGLMQKLLTKGIGHMKFKKTEFGEIPEEWEVVKIQEITKDDKRAIKVGPFGSQLKKSEYVDSGIKVYGQENVFKKDFDYGTYYITKEKFESLSAFEIFPGDIVITMMGTIGDCMVVPEKISKGIMNSHLMRLQLKSNVTPEYLAILITDAFFVKKQINRLSQGAIMSGLNSKIIKQIFIPLPSINEQRKLVEICKKISDASAEEINYLTKLKELKKGLMQDLLTGKVRVCV